MQVSRGRGCRYHAHNCTKASLQHASREGVDRKLDVIPDFCPCKSAFVEDCDRCVRENERCEGSLWTL
jgi:hypothetical protein